jgi:hypothetical protein
MNPVSIRDGKVYRPLAVMLVETAAFVDDRNASTNGLRDARSKLVNVRNVFNPAVEPRANLSVRPGPSVLAKSDPPMLSKTDPVGIILRAGRPDIGPKANADLLGRDFASAP